MIYLRAKEPLCLPIVRFAAGPNISARAGEEGHHFYVGQRVILNISPDTFILNP